MRKCEIRERLILAFYLIGFVVCALTLALFQPIKNTPPIFSNPPDEHARYLIPQYICEHGTIPTGFEEEIRIEGYGFSYGLYNVFPYIVQGYAMRLVSLFTEDSLALLYTARFVNVLSGLFMAIVVYLLGKRLFCGGGGDSAGKAIRGDGFRWLFCFAVMYLPQNLFMHTYVNTDSMCLLSTAMMVYGVVRAYQEGFTVRNCVWMSGGIILCALSYYNAYGYILSCIFLFVGYFISCEKGKLTFDYRTMLRKGLFISALVLLGIGWWFGRQYIVLDGDFLGLSTRQKLAEQFAIDSVNPLYAASPRAQGLSLWQMLFEQDTLFVTFQSFVATFGSMSMISTNLLYLGYGGLFAIATVGCVALVIKKLRHMEGRRIFLHSNLWFCILMPTILMIYYAYTKDYQPQGRYVMPAVVPLMYYVVRGIQHLSDRLSGYWASKTSDDSKASDNFKTSENVKPKLANTIITIGFILCVVLIVGGTFEMIFHRCLPIYLESGIDLS